MNVYYGFDNVPRFKEAVGTVGSYDGVHLAHRALLDAVTSRACSVGGQSVVLTFEPHPRITLNADSGLQLLTTLDEKIYLLEQYGIQHLVVIPFTEEFSRLSKEQFLRDYLVNKVGIKHLVAGYNHHFGHNKEGDAEFVKECGIDLTRIEQLTVGHCKVSSTIIRSLIRQGAYSGAEKLLGHAYIIIGMSDNEGVVQCDPYKLLPIEGCYKAFVNGHLSNIEIMPDNRIGTDVTDQKVTIKL